MLMINASQIQEHMEVIGLDSQHVGTVDHVDGQRINLGERDTASDGQRLLPAARLDRPHRGRQALSEPSRRRGDARVAELRRASGAVGPRASRLAAVQPPKLANYGQHASSTAAVARPVTAPAITSLG